MSAAAVQPRPGAPAARLAWNSSYGSCGRAAASRRSPPGGAPACARPHAAPPPRARPPRPSRRTRGGASARAGRAVVASRGTWWKSAAIHRRDDDRRPSLPNRSRMMSASHVEITIFRERQPVGGVHPRRLAVVEALVVLDEVELPAAARGRRRHRPPPTATRWRRPRRRRAAPPRSTPVTHCTRAREPRHPVRRPRSTRLRHHARHRPPRRHDHGHLVAAPRQPVGVGEDRAHAARDPQMRRRGR